VILKVVSSKKEINFYIICSDERKQTLTILTSLDTHMQSMFFEVVFLDGRPQRGHLPIETLSACLNSTAHFITGGY
jgi:hypothetical protein